MEKNNCSKCEAVDSEEMVQCDQCDLWFHFACVGVTHEIENTPWSCDECATKDKAAASSQIRKSASCESVASMATAKRNNLLLLQKLEEERKINLEFIEKKYKVLAMEEIEEEKIKKEESSQEAHKQYVGEGVKADQNREELPSAPLTQQTIAARQIIGKDLPVFTGNVEEWPIFYSNYVESNQVCQFSNHENIIRLQRCLRGRAMEAVKHRLLLPENAPEIIQTLKTLYGRPELIVQSILQRIKNEPPIKLERMDTLIHFALSVKNLCATIEASRLTYHLQNPTLVQELVDKLPVKFKIDWALYKRGVTNVTLVTFANWIYEIGEATYEMCNPIDITKTQKKEKAYFNTHDQVETKCRVCGRDCLSIPQCKTFDKMDRSTRWAKVKELALCRTCLTPHNNKCRSNNLCGKNGCVYKHHPMLHNDFIRTPGQEEMNDLAASTLRPSVNTHHMDKRNAIFRILPVNVRNGDLNVSTYAFLDEGSSITLMDDDLCQELKIKGDVEPLCLMWTNDTRRVEKGSKKVTFEISGVNTAKFFRVHNARTVKRLNLPTQSMNYSYLQGEYEQVKGLPIRSYIDARPKLLIGLDNWSLAVPLRVKEGNPGEPIATKTRLGWSIYGTQKDTKIEEQFYHGIHICECNNDTEMHEMVKQFFRLDSLGTGKPAIVMSKEDELATSILRKKTKRVDGRYETGLLWKAEDISLPDNYDSAKKRLGCLENKLSNNPALAANLKLQINQYQEKDYVRKLDKKEMSLQHPRRWYLPIFPVINPNKPDKIRIVWDAAAKYKGISLNSCLMKGPDQLSPLLDILLRFREKKIAICGDIKEMFHQIEIKREDQHSQMFLWRDCDTLREPDIYVMRVLTFGASCSPATAQYVKNINAETFRTTSPRAVFAIQQNHYVDDWLDCGDSPEELLQLAQEVRDIHKHGGFALEKWTSNSSIVVQGLEGEKLKTHKNLDIDANMEKVLGMWWDTSADEFTFFISPKKLDLDLLQGNRKPTKRELLRVLMSVFDPLGLLGHYVIYLKILLQEVWRSAIDWDDHLTAEHYEKWLIWISHLSKVKEVRMPRHYRNSFSEYSTVQLHVFVDASENAYAAVAYARYAEEERFRCVLIGSKTRVAPLRATTIPRLELEAALLGTRLASVVTRAQTFTFKNIYFWTDSRTVLSWLMSDHRKYKPYVAFRVSEILDSTDASSWRWLPSKENVADEATKWGSIPSFNQKCRWYTGPLFLSQPEGNWPQAKITGSVSEELRPKYVNHIRLSEPLIDYKRFSKWKKLVRSAGYIFRFLNNLRNRAQHLETQTGHLKAEELTCAENLLFRISQEESYSKEHQILEQNRPLQNIQRVNISKDSPLHKLTPYIDIQGVIRAHLRIDLADNVSRDIKRPIILNKTSYITKLIVQHYHERFYHRNHETVLNEIHQRFYIAGLRTMLKSIRRQCQICKNLSAVPRVPRMADLPYARVASFTRPFSYVGVDYFGPMTVIKGRRSEKRWGVIFTCLTTRAIHLEVAYSLSTDSCILALRNFMNRRGVPIEIHSDNGTNFQGASRELSKEIKAIDNNKLALTFTTTTTKWKFIPPASPHMGGAWERLVRSVKSTLQQIKLHRHPTDETLLSMLIEVENIVNSRPLTQLRLSDENEEALTPNHFLLGSASGVKQKGELDDSRKVLKRNWELSQQFASRFWKRWVNEYLPEITRRTKWHDENPPIQVGDVVVIVSSDNPTSQWPKGRVIAVNPGPDGRIRQATVQTSSGTYQRPVSKLAVLDVGAHVKLGGSSSAPTGGGENVSAV